LICAISHTISHNNNKLSLTQTSQNNAQA